MLQKLHYAIRVKNVAAGELRTGLAAQLTREANRTKFISTAYPDQGTATSIYCRFDTISVEAG